MKILVYSCFRNLDSKEVDVINLNILCREEWRKVVTSFQREISIKTVTKDSKRSNTVVGWMKLKTWRGQELCVHTLWVVGASSEYYVILCLHGLGLSGVYAVGACAGHRHGHLSVQGTLLLFSFAQHFLLGINSTLTRLPYFPVLSLLIYRGLSMV